MTVRASEARALKIRITGEIRDGARNGRYTFVHDRGQDVAAGIWAGGRRAASVRPAVVARGRGAHVLPAEPIQS